MKNLNTEHIMQWQSEDRNDLILKGITFLLSPVLCMLYSLYRINTRSSFFMLFAVFVTTGFSICTKNYDGVWMDYDIFAYRGRFEETAMLDWHQFGNILSRYFSGEGVKDIVIYIFYFLVSRFTSNYHVVFGLIAAIMAYFMLRTTRYLVAEKNYTFSISCLLLLFLFTVAQIEKIAVFRWYIAFWISMYSIFRIFISHKKKYYLLLLLTPLFHGSYVVIYLVLALYWLIRNRPKLTLVLLVISLLFSRFSVQAVQFALNLLPNNIGENYSVYIDALYMFQINESGTGFIWVRRWLEKILFLSLPVVSFIYSYYYKSDIQGTKCNSLYFLLIAFVIFVCFTIEIPSLGSRFMMFVYPLAAYIFLVCFHQRKLRNLLYLWAGLILLCVCSMLSVYQLPSVRTWMNLWEPEYFFMSPLLLFFKYVILY